jgi:hypothetical protein
MVRAGNAMQFVAHWNPAWANVMDEAVSIALVLKTLNIDGGLAERP